MAKIRVPYFSRHVTSPDGSPVPMETNEADVPFAGKVSSHGICMYLMAVKRTDESIVVSSYPTWRICSGCHVKLPVS